jgi:Uma2 family endonuclease
MSIVAVYPTHEDFSALMERRRFTVRDYAVMRIAGVFKDDERVELLDGEICKLSPIGPIHAEIVDRLTRIFIEQDQGLAQVRIQGPAQLNEYSEPQPDLLLLRKKVGGYAQRHPLPDEVLLVVEVSDSSLEFDRKIKIPSYAAAGILEAWIVDTKGQRIEQYFDAKNGKYENPTFVSIEQTIHSKGSPTIEFEVRRLFV